MNFYPALPQKIVLEHFGEYYLQSSTPFQYAASSYTDLPPQKKKTTHICVLPVTSNSHPLNVFEQEGESGRNSLSPTSASQPGGHSDISLMESSVKRGRAIFEKMSSENGQNSNAEG